MKDLKRFLDSKFTLSLATCVEAPWICTVYYFTDKELNLYFISSPKSKHSVDLNMNEQVACAIADSDQKYSASKEAVQLQGIVTKVNSVTKLKWFFNAWKKLNNMEKKLTYNNFCLGKLDSVVYKIKPTYVKYMNTKLYKDTYKIFNLNERKA